MKLTGNTQELLQEIAQKTPSYDALMIALTEQYDIVNKKSHVIDEQQKQINLLEEQLRLLRQQRYGKSSEKNAAQGELFNEAELLSDQGEAEDRDVELNTGQPEQAQKKKQGRSGLSPDLPRKKIWLRLTDEQKRGAIDTFFVTVKEELDITPAKVQVLQYQQEKAVFLDEQGTRTLIEADRPKHPLGKAIASPALLAYLIIGKYCDGLPLYRQEGILKRFGAQMTRTTLANWLIRLSLELQPLRNLLQETQLLANSLQGDETRMQVLKEPGMEATGHKWIWVMRGGPPGQPVVLFNYDKSRGKAVAKRLLEYFEGTYFQSDGYAGYDQICIDKGIIHLGCWDHARRKFVEAEKAQPKQKHKKTPPSKATMALSLINKLYRIEREIKALDSDEKYAQRQIRSVPALDKLKQWLDRNSSKIAKGSLTRKALDYTLNQWPKLIRYCEHGDLNLSNAMAENAIRPFVIGRKAWLFADTPAGANASALYYTLIETAKANGREPYAYLSYVIGNMANAETVEQWEALLPWNMK
jgi:transposase/uncharacterized coiled-coil protein SlyX